MTDTPSGKPHLSWAGKFWVACRGIWWGIRGQSSFLIQIPAAILAISLAVFFQFDALRWMILLLCIGAVITTELINSGIERLFHGLPTELQNRCWPALDIAAGAVLMASLFALVVGLILFLPPILLYFR